MKIVIALGGNALGNSPEEQLELVKKTSKTIVDLVEEGADVVVTHGNGPQVGMINLAMEQSHNSEAKTPNMPFAECGSMSQGYIGYHLQQAIQNELTRRNIKKECVTVITQVEVNKKDPAFQNPTKPIGSFYNQKEAEKISKEQGYIMKEDAGRGYRRVVPSPFPQRIVEINTIEDLVKDGKVVITCGGGGIPVIKTKDGYKGIDAVIDKDNSSARLAIDLQADMLMILTAVDKICINYNQENEQSLDTLTTTLAKRYIKKGEFAKGSMLPKVEACLKFTEETGKNSIVTSLLKAREAIRGENGTLIKKEKSKNTAKKENLVVKIILTTIITLVLTLALLGIFI